MIFAIDVGNTNIVLGLIKDGEIVSPTLRARTERDATWAEYAVKINDFFSFWNVNPKDIECSIIASVVPAVVESISIAMEKLTGKKCLVVSNKVKSNINIDIDDPSSLGADLLVGAVAATEYYGYPNIVMDLGTGTTITAVDKNRNFIGGAIIPGVQLSYNALSKGTSLLPSIAIEPPDTCIGRNTIDCMSSGAVYGTASMIDGMIERMEKEIGPCIHVATGGLAGAIISQCKTDIIVDDDLLLKGLWKLYEMNK